MTQGESCWVLVWDEEIVGFLFCLMLKLVSPVVAKMLTITTFIKTQKVMKTS